MSPSAQLRHAKRTLGYEGTPGAWGVERTGFHAVIVPWEGKEGIGAGTGEGSEPVRSRRWVAWAP